MPSSLLPSCPDIVRPATSALMIASSVAMMTASNIGVIVFVIRRFGVLAVIVTILFTAVLDSYPITFDLSAWYAEGGIFALIVTSGLGLYSLLAALGRKPLRSVMRS